MAFTGAEPVEMNALKEFEHEDKSRNAEQSLLQTLPLCVVLLGF